MATIWAGIPNSDIKPDAARADSRWLARVMWLTLARDAAAPEETWITDQYTAALKQAAPDQRTRALDLVNAGWIEQSRSGRDRSPARGS